MIETNISTSSNMQNLNLKYIKDGVTRITINSTLQLATLITLSIQIRCLRDLFEGMKQPDLCNLKMK